MNEFNCPTDIGGLLTLKFPNGRKKFYPVHRGHYSDAETFFKEMVASVSSSDGIKVLTNNPDEYSHTKNEHMFLVSIERTQELTTDGRKNLVSAIMGTLSTNDSCNIPDLFWRESNLSWVWSPVNWEIPCQILSLEKVRNSRFVVTSRGKTITLEGDEEVKIFQQFLYFCNIPQLEIDCSRPVSAVIRLEAWNSFLKDYAKKLMN